MVVGAGYERRENETYSWEGRRRAPFSVIQHTIAGRGELDFAGVRHSLQPGDTMLLNFPHPNRYWLAPGQRWEYFWIGVNGREALRVTRAIIDARGPVLQLNATSIDRLAGICRTLAVREPLIGEASALAYAAVMAVHDGLFQPDGESVDRPPGPIGRTMSHIDRHISEHLDVDRLAAVAGLSRAHFVRLFSRTVGASPSTYVAEQRLQLAQRLLTATDATVVEIASTCGFASANYFTKVFRTKTSLTPSAYRQSMRFR